VAVSERHTVEIRAASEVQEGDEILSRQYKRVRIAKTEHYPGSVTLYDREGPPRHVLRQIGQFARAELVAVVVSSAQEPTDAEVELGARALCQEAKATDEQGDWNPWDRLYDSEKEELRREVRAVLKAARDGTAAEEAENRAEQASGEAPVANEEAEHARDSAHEAEEAAEGRAGLVPAMGAGTGEAGGWYLVNVETGERVDGPFANEVEAQEVHRHAFDADHLEVRRVPMP
jgi:hypothetical protein